MLKQDVDKTREYLYDAEEYIRNAEEKREIVLRRIEKYGLSLFTRMLIPE